MATQIKREPINIPEEIIEEILFDLPVKSLLRFKCVSKRWRSLISSKHFIKHHLDKSKTNHKLVKLCCDRTNYSLTSYSVRSLIDGNRMNTTTLDHYPMGINWGPIVRSDASLSYHLRRLIGYDPTIATFEGGRFRFRVLGSCNGLILISINRTKFILWNPSTREANNITPSLAAKNITPSIAYYLEQRGLNHFVYRFGYDESSDDFKVVFILSYSNSKPYLTYIYSSRTDSWKRIDNFDECFPTNYHGKFVSGRLHWQTYLEGSFDIVSLDLVEEKFGTLAQPKNFSTNDYCRTTVEDLGGYLCLVSLTRKPGMDVWVMMTYGQVESWTKIWTRSDIYNFNIPYPFWLRKNGDIAVRCGSSVAVYNGKNKLRKSHLDVFKVDIQNNLFVESLVSPFVDHGPQ